MRLIAFAGLPGTGKSTLARALAARLRAHVLDKDVVRAALFGPDRIEYSREQDDLVLRAIHEAAAHLAQRGERFVILDGRTYSRRDQVETLESFTRAKGIDVCWIECTCVEEIALARIETDQRRGDHFARNRSADLYREIAATREPLESEHVSIDTSRGSTSEHVESCLAHLRARGWFGD